MLTAEPILEPSAYDLNHVLVDQEGIRKFNQQRFEMEWLTAIVYEDIESQICVGYRDVGHDEFWARGNYPGTPTVPSMLICETAAQLCSYYAQRSVVAGSSTVGLGGIDQLEFGDPVRPGDRLVIVGKVHRLRKGVLLQWKFQALVEGKLVAQGFVKGVPLPEDWFTNGLGAARSPAAAKPKA